jgi:hypothetical protein
MHDIICCAEIHSVHCALRAISASLVSAGRALSVSLLNAFTPSLPLPLRALSTFRLYQTAVLLCLADWSLPPPSHFSVLIVPLNSCCFCRPPHSDPLSPSPPLCLRVFHNTHIIHPPTRRRTLPARTPRALSSHSVGDVLDGRHHLCAHHHCLVAALPGLRSHALLQRYLQNSDRHTRFFGVLNLISVGASLTCLELPSLTLTSSASYSLLIFGSPRLSPFVTLSSSSLCVSLSLSLPQNGLIGWALPYASGCQFSMGMIAASIMIERSPAAVIAVVRELRAKGEVCNRAMHTVFMSSTYAMVFCLCLLIKHLVKSDTMHYSIIFL